MEIDVFPQQAPEEGINVYPEGVVSPPTGDVARERAVKFDKVLGDRSPGIDHLQLSIESSQEDSIRRNYSLSRENDLHNRRTRALIDGARRGVNPSEARALAAEIQNPKPVDPTTSMERGFAEWYTNNITDRPDPALQEAARANPESYKNLVHGSNYLLSMNLGIVKELEDLEARHKLTPVGQLPGTSLNIYGPVDVARTTLQMAGQFMPLLSGANIAPTKSSLTSQLGESILAGSTMEQERDKYWSFRDPDEAVAWLRGRVAQIEALNPLDAIDYVQKILHFSRDDKLVGNIFGGIDATSLGVGGLLKGALAAQGARAFMHKYFKDAASALNTGKYRAEDTAAAVGDIAKAADIINAKKILQKSDPENLAEEIYTTIPGAFNPSLHLNPGSMAREAALRQNVVMKDDFSKLMSAVTSTTRVPRVPESALHTMLAEGRSRVEYQHPSVHNHFIDMNIIETRANNTLIGEYRYGKRSGEYFDSPAQADNYAQNQLGLDHRYFKIKEYTEGVIGPELPPERALYKGQFTREQVEKTIAANEKHIASVKSGPEIIKEAAIKIDRKIYTGVTHADALNAAEKALGKRIDDLDDEIAENFSGFVTNRGRYVNREEANKIAIKNEQISKGRLNINTGRLLAEDISSKGKTSPLNKADKDRIAKLTKTNKGMQKWLDSTFGPKQAATSLPKNDLNAPASVPEPSRAYLEKIEQRLTKEFPTEGVMFIRPKLTKEEEDALKSIPGIKLEDGQLFFSDLTRLRNEMERLRKGLPRKDASGSAGSRMASEGTLTKEEQSVIAGIKETFAPTLKQQGSKWFISMVKPLDETSPLARQHILDTTNTNPITAGSLLWGDKGLWDLVGSNRAITALKSANDQLAPLQRGNRKIALHAQTEMLRLLGDHAKIIGTLSKDSREAMRKVLDANRDFYDFQTGQAGMRYESPAALEKAWISANGRPPTVQESEFYWRYHNIMDIDWVVRDFGVSRDLLRQGMEEFNFRLGSGDMMKEIRTNGRLTPEFPWHDKGDPGILIITNKDPVQHMWLSEIKTKGLEKFIEELLNDGYRTIKIGNPTERFFKEHTGVGNTVNYVVTKDFDSRPLPMKQVDHRPGVHIEYTPQYQVKVPIVERSDKGRLTYYGDQTLFLFHTEKEAKRVAKAIEDLRALVRKNASEEDLNKFIHRNLNDDWKWWSPKLDPEKGIIGMEHPVVNTYSGKTALETHTKLKERYESDPTFHNERDSEHNLYRAINMDFIANRNGPVDTIVKSAEQPIYVRQEAKKVDPFVVMERALVNSARNFYMNDVKISSIEQWVAQNAKFLTMDSNQAKANPFQAFYKGQFNENVEDRAGLAAAKNSKTRITQFLGTKSEFGRDLSWFETFALNQMGEKWASRYKDHERSFQMINDPISFTRKWMFNFIFAGPKQFWIQAQGFAGTSGILIGAHGPVEGMKLTAKAQAAYNATVVSYFTDNPAILNRLYKISGWPKERITDSIQGMRTVGWDNIGAEQAMKDYTMDPKIYNRGKDVILDTLTIPFREGERIVRINAWHAAYLEWEKANPGKFLFDKRGNPTSVYDINKILDRADDLSYNMTRAGNSALQEGFARLPAQFYTFTQRQLELYWGDRLTTQEKAGLFATQSVIYGIPAALGAATLYPFYEEIEKHAKLNGYSFVKSAWYKLMTEGFLAWGASWILGSETDISQRYGPNINDRLKKLLKLEVQADFLPPLLVAGLGASGTFIDGILTSAYPGYMHIYGALAGGQNVFPLTTSDWIQASRNIVFVNDTISAWDIINTGKYFNRKGGLVATDMTIKDAILLWGFGLTNKKITDAYLTLDGIKGQIEQQKFYTKLIEEQLILAYRHGVKDWNEALPYLVRAKVYIAKADLSTAQQADIYKRINEKNFPMVQQATKMFITQGKAGQLPARLKLLLGTQQ